MVSVKADSDDRGMPPYISYSTFTTLLEWLSSMQTLPHRFDRTLWADKFSGSVGAQPVTALRFLGLLDGDRVNERLEQLVATPIADRKRALKELFREAYGSEFIDVLGRQTAGSIEEHLQQLGASDATQRKAFSFLVNAAKALEIPLQGSVTKKARNRPSILGRRGASIRGSLRDEKKSESEVAHDVPNGRPVDSGTNSINSQQPNEPSLKLHPIILSLLKELEKRAPTWTTQERESWAKVFQINLDYVYPATDTGDTKVQN